ncbi:DUF885 domain-containing protein [Marilutibacter chinensis]|uniref:DUF885 domain-containing protein n=1 Tax=Marilutibacter chinensis TaxID=2912247 RepID=A0ABS9HNY8_9GAMM|nr:DUF885 domain-containing protein [Lysobacter chinensis]MCF7220690.1 DUF885 domain-containing protein [Lysobacter chinensis]
MPDPMTRRPGRTSRTPVPGWSALACACALSLALSAVADEGADARMKALAERAVALGLEEEPIAGYVLGLPLKDHAHWSPRAPEDIARIDAAEDAMLAELETIDRDALGTAALKLDHALLTERLESQKGLRVCRPELWDVNHMGGWPVMLARYARFQPVATAVEREQALERWSALPAFVDQEIANLRQGLDLGYSAPRSVVERVIGQVDGLATASVADSPLSGPAGRSDDSEFRTAFEAVIRDRVNPALARYRDFLRDEYMAEARTELGVSANPDGEACYDASLRGYTTLDRGAREVHELGAKAVAANMAEIAGMGEKLYGTDDFAEILERVREAPDNGFSSEAELIDYSREVVARSREASRKLFLALPEQEMKVEPFPDFMRGSGASAHYEAAADPTQPAYYRIDSEGWASETRGSAEITAVHEGFPGHHMQLAFAFTQDKTPLAQLSFNSAYAEGWGRYAERLAEEAGIYSNDYAKIQRRAWPARGMVADTGLHVLGWSREKTVEYLKETGRFGPDETEALADRMAMLPGQLTAYDSGALEIVALREQAEAALGDRFDLRLFHEEVLRHGNVPMQVLRANVEAWIAGTQQVADGKTSAAP